MILVHFIQILMKDHKLILVWKHKISKIIITMINYLQLKLKTQLTIWKSKTLEALDINRKDLFYVMIFFFFGLGRVIWIYPYIEGGFGGVSMGGFNELYLELKGWGFNVVHVIDI